jgi:hypothetical protein
MTDAVGPVVTGSPISLVNAAIHVAGYSTTRPVPCHAIMFQALPTNTGKVYICKATGDPSTMVGVYATLGVPTANLIPSFSLAITIAPNALNLGDYWVTSDVAGEGVLVDIVVL